MIPLPPGFSNWEPPEQETPPGGGGFFWIYFQQDRTKFLERQGVVLQIPILSYKFLAGPDAVYPCYIHVTFMIHCARTVMARRTQ